MIANAEISRMQKGVQKWQTNVLLCLRELAIFVSILIPILVGPNRRPDRCLDHGR